MLKNPQQTKPMRMSRDESAGQICLEFDDNERLSLICGQQNCHLARIEQALHVGLSSFGNQITIAGDYENVDKASQAFTIFIVTFQIMIPVPS